MAAYFLRAVQGGLIGKGLRDTLTPWELSGRQAHLYGHKVMGMLRVL